MPEILEVEAARAVLDAHALGREIAAVHAPDEWFLKRGTTPDAVTHALGVHDPGAPVFPYLLSGGTDNKSLSRLGIAGYGFAPLRLPEGLDFPGMFHGVDERVPLDALSFGRAVLRDLLLGY